MDDGVMISVDPRKASNTAAVLDPATKTVLASQRFANTAAGYGELRRFGDRWQQRRWAVEGCHGAGRLLSRRLVADGELVLDVPAKLAARVRVYSQGHGRKTDADDAVSIGLAALNGNGVAAARAAHVACSASCNSASNWFCPASNSVKIRRAARIKSATSPPASA